MEVGDYDASRQSLVTYVGIKAPCDTPPRSSFAHDLAFTKNWMVIFESSVQFDKTKILSRNESVLAFQRQVPKQIGFIPRFVWIDAGTHHALVHALNAWEEKDGTVVLWLPVGDDFDGDIDTGVNMFLMIEFRMNPRT